MKNATENNSNSDARFIRFVWLFVFVVGAAFVTVITLYFVKSELFCDFRNKSKDSLHGDDLTATTTPDETSSSFQN